MSHEYTRQKEEVKDLKTLRKNSPCDHMAVCVSTALLMAAGAGDVTMVMDICIQTKHRVCQRSNKSIRIRLLP